MVTYLPFKWQCILVLTKIIKYNKKEYLLYDTVYNTMYNYNTMQFNATQLVPLLYAHLLYFLFTVTRTFLRCIALSFPKQALCGPFLRTEL